VAKYQAKGLPGNKTARDVRSIFSVAGKLEAETGAKKDVLGAISLST